MSNTETLHCNECDFETPREPKGAWAMLAHHNETGHGTLAESNAPRPEAQPKE